MVTTNTSVRKTCGTSLIATIENLLILVFILFSFHSCAPIYYAPNSSNVPLLKEKGQAKLSGYYSSCEDVSGVELQGALAVSKNIGVMLNTAYLNGGSDGNGYLVEGGAGYYKLFEKKWVFESYGGLGFGSANNNSVDGGSSSVNFTKCFVQPSLGFTTKNFEFGVASRFSGVFFNVGDYAPGTYSWESPNLEYLRAHPNSYLWEPSAFVGFGIQDLKIRMQVTLSENMYNKELNQEEINVGLGLVLNIAPKKDKN